MKQVDQNTTGIVGQGSVGNQSTESNPPADLSAANGDTQTEKEEELSSADLSQAPAPEMTAAPKPNPYQELVDVFNGIKGSLSASHQHELGSKIAAVGSFMDDEFTNNWKQQLEDAGVAVESAKKEVELHKEDSLQTSKRVEFLETQLQEAKDENQKLQEEIARLNTPSMVPDPKPENAAPDLEK